MLLLTEKQIDRTVALAPYMFALSPLLIWVQIKFVPQGFGIGVLTLCSLFSLGFYALAFSEWRSDRGLWMLAALLVVTETPCYVYFAYWRYVAELQLLAAGPRPVPFDWKEFKLAADIVIWMGLFQYLIRLAITVAIENWRRTRHMPFPVW